MRTFITYLVIFATTFLLFNCKKYPEGGCERRGPKNIIGDWKLSLYEVNGIDSTELINYNNSNDYKKVTITKNGSNFSVSANGYNGYALNFLSNKSVAFSNTDLESGIKCVNSATNSTIQNCYRLYFVPEIDLSENSTAWTILKLTKTELTLTTSQKNDYKLKFKK